MRGRIPIIGTIALMALLAAPSVVSAAPSGCANASISIRTGTETVAPGTTIGIAGGVSSCSSQKERFNLVVSAMSSCGQRSDIASSRIVLNAGENKIWTVSYPVPQTTCAGPWVVTVQVGDGNGGRAYEINGALSTASTTITIQ